MPRTLIPAVAILAALAGIQPVGASNPWARLHRPLHLPRLAPGSACPVSRVDPRFDWQRFHIIGGSGIGRGPVYPGLGDSAGRLYTQADDQNGGPWARGKLFWYVRPSYRGRVLIRGQRLDGPQSLGFNGGRLPSGSCESTSTKPFRGRANRRGAVASLRTRACSHPAATACRSTAPLSVESWSLRSRLRSFGDRRAQLD